MRVCTGHLGITILHLKAHYPGAANPKIVVQMIHKDERRVCEMCVKKRSSYMRKKFVWKVEYK